MLSSGPQQGDRSQILAVKVGVVDSSCGTIGKGVVDVSKQGAPLIAVDVKELKRLEKLSIENPTDFYSTAHITNVERKKRFDVLVGKGTRGAKLVAVGK